MEKQSTRYKTTCKIILIVISPIIVVYIAVTAFFCNHLYFKSTVNRVNVSCKSVKEIEEDLPSELNNYVINIYGRDNKNEQITGQQINLRISDVNKIQEIKNNQNPFGWFASLFFKSEYHLSDQIIFDDDLLNKAVDNLSYFKNENIVESQNPTLSYDGNAFVITPEINGTRVIKENMLEKIKDSIQNGDSYLNLEDTECYQNPQFTAESQNVKDAKDLLNKYIQTKVTYKFGENNETLDGAIISGLLSVDNNYNVVIDNNKIKQYVKTLGDKYNSVGKSRSFKTTKGSVINVTGGNYGNMIDNDKETLAIVDLIKNGQVVEREPEYKQKAASTDSNDIGNTYLEVDLTDQHLWFYKGGNVIVDGDVVSGNVSAGNATPAGVYEVNFKQKDAVLRGANYASPVNYWMPFNGGIGLHDASWRSTFGGSIYLYNGSHGCVNAPYNLASKVFENIEAGTPVVCYY